MELELPPNTSDELKAATQAHSLVKPLIAALVVLACLVGGYVLTPRLSAISASMVAPEKVDWIEVISPASDLRLRRPAASESPSPMSGQWDKKPVRPRQFSTMFKVDWPQDQARSLYVPGVGGILNVYVNGIHFENSVAMHSSSPGLGNQFIYQELPQSIYQPGINRINFIVQDDGSGTGLKYFYFGPTAQLYPLFAAQAKWAGRQSLILLAVGLVLAFGGLATTIISKRRALALLICVAGVLFAGQGYGYQQADTALFLALDVQFRAPLHIIFVAVTAVFLSLWTQGEKREQIRLVWSALIIISLVALEWVTGAGASAFTRPLLYLIGLALTGFIGFRLLRYYQRQSTSEAWQTGLFVIAFAALGAGVFQSIFKSSLSPQFHAMTLINLGLLPVYTGLLMVILVNAIRDYRSKTAYLTALVSEKEAALQAELQKRAVLEERQRLTRDMHDGIGGQLLSLLVRVRSGNIGIEQVEDEIQDGLNDLRLIVDSMDHTGEDLTIALTTFRSRVKAQLDALGIELDWQQSKSIKLAQTTPRTTLNIYRFLQEAVSNIIRHSRAKTVKISLSQAAPASPLIISVMDDGRGFSAKGAKATTGKGIPNMQARAGMLGGHMDIKSGLGGTGTCITLTLPQATD